MSRKGFRLDDARRDLDGKSEEIIEKRAACTALALKVAEKQKNIGDVDQEMKDEKSDTDDLHKQVKAIQDRHGLKQRPSTYENATAATAPTAAIVLWPSIA